MIKLSKTFKVSAPRGGMLCGKDINVQQNIYTYLISFNPVTT